MFKIKINGKKCAANAGETILDVATREKINIPTLCYLKGMGATSNCRICLVEVVGQKSLVTACSFKVFDGMEVLTNTQNVINARKMNLELILSNHNYDCKNCVKGGNCELAKLAQEYKVDGKLFVGGKTESECDNSSPCVIRDSSKCILCKKCVQVCDKMQSVNAIGEINRGFNTQIGCAFNKGLLTSTCVGCGQCVLVCPTGALHENENLTEVEKLLKDKSKLKIVAPAPAVRVALLENFGFDAKTTENLIPAIFKKLGFDKVFDINFGADLTVLEESAEFLERLKENKNMPLFTSCCPAWVDFVNKFYPELKQNVSSCKSPLMMFGAIAKTYYADKINKKAKDIAVVSVMPCTAKKGESLAVGELGVRDIDATITVRELIYLINKFKIDIKSLSPMSFDSVLGESSGAGVIFGASGGVMEAAIRTLSDQVLNKDINKIDYVPVYGIDGAKMATIDFGGKKINIAVVSGLNNARGLIEKIKNKELDLHFIEVMACPLGCINGGGMPIKKSDDQVKKRMEGLYNLDKDRRTRKSHHNREVQDFLNWQKKSNIKAKLHTR